MKDEKLRMLRSRISPQLTDYIRSAGLPFYPPSLTLCPVCDEQAGIYGSLWVCPSCKASGDALDYEMIRAKHKTEADAMKSICHLLGIKITELDTVSASEIMDMEFERTGFLVEKLICKGVYILAGAENCSR